MAVLAFFGVVAVEATAGVPSAPVPELLFVAAHGPGGRTVMAAHADASGLRVLVPAAKALGYLDDPTVSPRGNQVAFRSRYGIAVATVAVRTVAVGMPRLVTHGDDYPIGLSPNGRWILFRRGDPDIGEVYVVASDGSRVRKLTTPRNVQWLWTPLLWTPDSTHILSQDAPGVVEWDLSGQRKRLFPATSNSRAVSFSPDGRFVVMARYDEINQVQGIQIARADFSHPRWLALASGGGTANPAWSPDSTTVAYVDQGPSQTRGVPWTIRVVRTDGTFLTQPRINPKYASGSLAWSPDGNHIAYEQVPSLIGVRANIWVADARNGTTRELATGARAGPLAWLP